MQISTVKVSHIARPLHYPWRTAYGEDAAIEGVLIHVQSGEYSGWGGRPATCSDIFVRDRRDNFSHYQRLSCTSVTGN